MTNKKLIYNLLYISLPILGWIILISGFIFYYFIFGVLFLINVITFFTTDFQEYSILFVLSVLNIIGGFTNNLVLLLISTPLIYIYTYLLMYNIKSNVPLIEFTKIIQNENISNHKVVLFHEVYVPNNVLYYGFIVLVWIYSLLNATTKNFSYSTLLKYLVQPAQIEIILTYVVLDLFDSIIRFIRWKKMRNMKHN